MEKENGNFIKINRSILEWRWYKNGNTARLFLHLLLKANWKDASFEEYEIKRGSFVTSLQALASETGLTTNQVRTALEHLQKTGEITSKTTNKFTIITIEKYGVFQDVPSNDSQTKPQSNHNQITNKPQINHNQITTIEEEKEYKEEKEREENSPVSPFDSVWKEILALYPRCNGLELESKEKYLKTLEERKDKEEFLENTKGAINNYVERYRKENADDTGLKYIKGFKRFFSEELKGEIESYQSQKTAFTGWKENGDSIPPSELSEEFESEYEHEHRGKAEYMEVLREVYKKYPICNFIPDAYESLYFGIVNRYEDGAGANLLYAAVGKYLEDMKNKKQYSIPDFGYWLKHEAIDVMKTVTEYRKLIPE